MVVSCSRLVLTSKARKRGTFAHGLTCEASEESRFVASDDLGDYTFLGPQKDRCFTLISNGQAKPLVVSE